MRSTTLITLTCTEARVSLVPAARYSWNCMWKLGSLGRPKLTQRFSSEEEEEEEDDDNNDDDDDDDYEEEEEEDDDE